jgi:hypothetical protein
VPADYSTRIIKIPDIVLWYPAVINTRNWDGNVGAFDVLIAEDKIKLLGSLGENLSPCSSVEIRTKSLTSRS